MIYKNQSLSELLLLKTIRLLLLFLILMLLRFTGSSCTFLLDGLLSWCCRFLLLLLLLGLQNNIMYNNSNHSVQWEEITFFSFFF